MSKRGFIVEFQPLPIPTEPPDAPGGSYFYVSRQWAAYLRGLVRVLEFKRFWSAAPEQYETILAWVYKLLDEIELPDGETIEVPIYIPVEAEDDYSNENCEDDCMACNCGSVANVRYCEDTGWEYRNSAGQWVPVPSGAVSPPPDDETPVGETPPPTVSQNACEKAWGIWDTLYRYMEAIEATVPTFDFDPIPVNLELSQMSAWWVVNMVLQRPDLPIQKINANYALAQWFAADDSDFHDEIDFLQTNKTQIGDEFICAMQDILSKDARLSDSELEAARNYEWQTGRPHLSTMLQQTLKRIVSSDFLKEQAALYVRSGFHVCPCAGNVPTPPPSTEPPANFFGFYPGVVVGQIDNTINPTQSLASANPGGVKISEQSYDSLAYPGGSNDKWSYVTVMFKATEFVTDVQIKFLWTYNGSPADNTWWAYMEGYAYGALNANSVWQPLPNHNISANSQQSGFWEPNSNFPLVEGVFPFAGVASNNYEYIGFTLKINLSNNNSGGNNPSHIIRNLELVAKATTGGNYRATLIPGQFKPKTV